MFKTQNGYTKETMKAKIRAGNNGKRAAVSGIANYGCMYFTPDGNRCAVGCFIPDGHEGQRLGGYVGTLLGRYPDLRDLMPLDALALSDLQYQHDTYEGTGDVRDVLCKWIDENVEDAP